MSLSTAAMPSAVSRGALGTFSGIILVCFFGLPATTTNAETCQGSFDTPNCKAGCCKSTYKNYYTVVCLELQCPSGYESATPFTGYTTYSAPCNNNYDGYYRSCEKSTIVATTTTVTTTTKTTTTTVTTTTTAVCADGEYRKAGSPSCQPKATACGPGLKFKAGVNGEQTKDDTTCTPCTSGKYKSDTSAATACAFKTVASECSTSQKYEAGNDSVKNADDTKCTACADGEYKYSMLTCKSKKVASDCGPTEKHEAGNDSVKNWDDSQCITCNDGEYKNTGTTCTAKNKACGAGFYYTAGTDSVKNQDDSQCTMCSGGEYKSSSGTTCTAKTAACGAGFYYTAGKDSVKSMDDVLCSVCPSGRYTTSASTATECNVKKIASDCNHGEQFTGGKDSEKRRDDTRCEPCDNAEYSISTSFGPEQLEAGSNSTQRTNGTAYKCAACSDGQYKNSTTSCTSKAAACATGEAFTAGNDSEKTKDDTACTACADGQYAPGRRAPNRKEGIVTTSQNTTCTAKVTMCAAGKYFAAGSNKEKGVDDTACIACANGEYKTGTSTATACKGKKTACGAGETFTVGEDSEQTQVNPVCLLYTRVCVCRLAYSCLATCNGSGFARENQRPCPSPPGVPSLCPGRCVSCLHPPRRH